MDWSHEFLNSAWWVLKVLFSCLFFLILCGVVLVKTTRWASQFWSLNKGFFNIRHHPTVWLNLITVILLSLITVRITVVMSYWNNELFTSFQEFNKDAFLSLIVIFCMVAFIAIACAFTQIFLEQRLIIKWREFLNEKMLNEWLNNQSYYRGIYLENPMDNPEQRIQQDTMYLTEKTISLLLGCLSAVVTTVSFVFILWQLSGELTILGITIPRAMVFIVFLYIAVATVFAAKLAKPLVRLNFLSERLNADYRYSLIRVREYAESIAFYKGERIEGKNLRQRFKAIIENTWQIVFKQMRLGGYNSTISQISVLFPIIIQSPRFFAQQIKLGDMMQTLGAVGTVSDGLSFFRLAYSDFTDYKATLDRLTGFDEAVKQANQLPVPSVQTRGDEFGVQQMSIFTPTGKLLVRNMSFSLTQGEALLIQGPSGTGKTTLLRCIAGLWPYSEGEVICPKENVLFLSQRPYLPEGRLVEALFYPLTPPDDAVAQIQSILADVKLTHLSEFLEEERNWMYTLSGGEQQRVAFARVLLTRPQVVFLDEATSAMDEKLEADMYRLIRHRYPDMRIISIGHRSTLLQHHTHLLQLHGEGKWEFIDLPA